MGWETDAMAPLASTANTLINAQTAKRNTDATIKANMELSEYAYGKDLEMWNAQNLYNAPASQMDRFSDAGLNPNLIFGQGTPGNASQLPKYQGIRKDYNYKSAINPMSALDAYQNFSMKSAQIDATRAQAESAQAEAENAKKYYNARAGTQNEKMDQLSRTRSYESNIDYMRDIDQNLIDVKGTSGSKLYETQLQYGQQRNLQVERNIAKIDQDIQYKKKQNEWFDANQYSNIGGAIIRGLQKFIPKGMGPKSMRGGTYYKYGGKRLLR